MLAATGLYALWLRVRLRRAADLASDAQIERARAEQELERAEHQRDIQQRRADEFFAIISGVEGEAQTWRRMYQQGMAGAGAAQSWLFRDLSEAVKRANAYAARLRILGEKATEVQVDPQLKRFVDEFDSDGKAEVPHVDATVQAQRVERETRGPAALNEPIEAQADGNDPN